jgi:hypothetical protein
MFIDAVETLLGRKVRAFSTAIEQPAGVVFEVFAFEPEKDVAASQLTVWRSRLPSGWTTSS